MKDRDYQRALCLLEGFLDVLNEAKIRPEIEVEIDLSRLYNTSPEDLACDILARVEDAQDADTNQTH